ncbi:MAG: hypothetical protein AAF907_11995, partial [Planctomycetota bacterium]
MSDSESAGPPAIAPPDPADAASPGRWRVAPTLLCGLIGGGALLQGAGSIVMTLIFMADLAWDVRPDPGYFWRNGALATAGAALIVAGAMWWAGRLSVAKPLLAIGAIS